MSRATETLYGYLLLTAFFVSACATSEHEPTGDTRNSLESQVWYYGDDGGLTVNTVGVGLSHQEPAATSVRVRAATDRIKIRKKGQVRSVSGNQSTGHEGVDGVSSASITASGGSTLTEERYYGTVNVEKGRWLDNPDARLSSQVYYSTEPDYQSRALGLTHAQDFLQKNFSLAVSAGAGFDSVEPETPVVSAQTWPARNTRWNLGASASQIISARSKVVAGISLAQQYGRLSSPYRQALVRTSLFPERLPERRARIVAFVGGAIYLGYESALHSRLGMYTDDWGVRGVIPEASLVSEIVQRVLIALKYRHYQQSAASFYSKRYENIEPTLAGDVRLGRLRERNWGAELSWDCLGERDEAGSMALHLGHQRSHLEYLDGQEEPVVAAIYMAGISGSL